MPAEQYDDWGNPLRPAFDRLPPPSKYQDFTSQLRSLLLPLRRFRTVILLGLSAVALLTYLTSFGGEEKPPPVDWTRFAYVQYATDDHNLCNSFMVFEALNRLGSKADRVLLYPNEWDLVDDSPRDRNSQLLLRAQKLYNVRLKPISLLDTNGKAKAGTLNKPSDWDTSITKLRAFELDEYDRVLHLDSDITLLQHLDELFSLPSTPIAMPRAYWSDEPPGQWPLTSMLMLIEPSVAEFKNLLDLLQVSKMRPEYKAGMKAFDMDLLNQRFASSALVLPHRPYALITAEFRRKDHAAYLGLLNGPRNRMTQWNPDKALAEAKLVHFSDWPLPKPWVMWPLDGLTELQPDCGGITEGTCRERTIWKGLYDDFRKRRKDLCRILSVPAPKWAELKNITGAT